jgi:hypothetical protein
LDGFEDGLQSTGKARAFGRAAVNWAVDCSRVLIL